MSSSSKRSFPSESPPRNNDAFLDSMTFASFFGLNGNEICDCDECECPDVSGGGNNGNSVVPPTIRQAIAKRRKLTEPYLRRTQDRRLVRRHPQRPISCWQWTLPRNNNDNGDEEQPILEFGNTPRVIFVHTKNERTSVLRSIGEGGIIGSQEEQNSRQIVDWEQGKAYWVPSNGGKAMGWIHTPAPADPNVAAVSTGVAVSSEGTASTPSSSPVVLYHFKMTADALEELKLNLSQNGDSDTAQKNSSASLCWTDKIRSLFVKNLDLQQIRPLSDDSVATIKEVLEELLADTPEG